mmetsp:Transcript_6725/g.11974  ORF Transcript_6725/g.11974 Transcript_6725/m.11974 type:complete len:589 (-) Transcript_6725:3337-5103(-)
MFKCPEFPWQLYVGRDYESVCDLQKELSDSTRQRFDFIQVPLVHERFGHPATLVRNLPMTRSDTVLEAREWNSCIVGKVSRNLHTESRSLELRTKAESMMKEQLDWGVHVGFYAIVLPSPQLPCSNFARVLNSYLIGGFCHQSIWVQIDVNRWDIWNSLRMHCGPSTALGIQLVLSRTVPSEAELKRWKGEPIKSVLVPHDAFIYKKPDAPTLPQQVCKLFKQFMRLKVNVVVGASTKAESLKAVLLYDFKKQESLTQREEFSHTYWDVLQSPLQPLMDNLETQTYEVFENDKIKYEQYQEAIFKALSDRDDLVTLCVVGAGRGPLVAASLKAAELSGKKIKVLVVEKNPNAIVTLRNRLMTDWKGQDVSIYHTDMRAWQPPCAIDLVISELLGSFGDNEGSPECLDCLTRILRPGGISIPCNSISYVAPVASHKCWTQAVTVEKKPECPYVVMMHNAAVLAEPQTCFSFYHPAATDDHRRYTRLHFTLETLATLHGFIGYFESQLYGPVSVSILPSTHTQHMCSWFPIFFPLKFPLIIRKECIIEVWRCCDDRKLWYEWQVTEWDLDCLLQTSGIHNSGGGVYWIGK